MERDELSWEVMVFCRVMGWKEEPEEVDAREGVCNNDTAIPRMAYRIHWPTLDFPNCVRR
jgi:hypothetical protein